MPARPDDSHDKAGDLSVHQTLQELDRQLTVWRAYVRGPGSTDDTFNFDEMLLLALFYMRLAQGSKTSRSSMRRIISDIDVRLRQAVERSARVHGEFVRELLAQGQWRKAHSQRFSKECEAARASVEALLNRAASVGAAFGRDRAPSESAGESDSAEARSRTDDIGQGVVLLAAFFVLAWEFAELEEKIDSD